MRQPLRLNRRRLSCLLCGPRQRHLSQSSEHPSRCPRGFDPQWPPATIYFHGNAANAATRASRIETILAKGFGIFYLNNRGYGGSEGKPTEKDNVADAIAAYDHLIGLDVPAARR
jgi:pimeloyl-ACP methyl ester carboxylesterase